MPRKKEETVKTEPKVAEKVSKTEVSIYDENKNFVRTYSKELHGDDFEVLAQQFISDRPNYSIK